jgi:hypothetical protein
MSPERPGCRSRPSPTSSTAVRGPSARFGDGCAGAGEAARPRDSTSVPALPVILAPPVTSLCHVLMAGGMAPAAGDALSPWAAAGMPRAIRTIDRVVATPIRATRVTGGDLARSRRWRESLERYGTGDELRVVAADERGCWGRFDLWRDSDDRPFDNQDAQLVHEASVALGRGMRRATVGLHDDALAAPLEAGVLLIDADLRPRGGTPAVYAWFRALNPAAMPYAGGIPSLVWSTTGRLIAAEAGEDPKRPVRIRARAADGTWAVVEAARLDDGGGGIAVSVHAAGMGRNAGARLPCLRAEQPPARLLTLIVQGHDTNAVARLMFISSYTVQDHLKSIFDKLDVHNRTNSRSRPRPGSRPPSPAPAHRAARDLRNGPRPSPLVPPAPPSAAPSSPRAAAPAAPPPSRNGRSSPGSPDLSSWSPGPRPRGGGEGG